MHRWERAERRDGGGARDRLARHGAARQAALRGGFVIRYPHMRSDVWALALVCVVGCGGESETEGDGNEAIPTCNAFSSCGGPVVGSWDITGTCLDSPASTVENCPDATARYSTYEADGTFVF